MFFYSQGDAFNVVASLSELETGALLLGQAAAPLNPAYRRWDDYGSAIARAVETGGKIHVTVEPGDDAHAVGAWRGPLDEAPEPCRAAITATLGFFARRGGQKLDRKSVEVIGLGGPKEVKR